MSKGDVEIGGAERIRRINELGRRIHDERPDLQEAFPLDNPEGIEGFWYWLNWFGPEPEYCHLAKEVAELLWPIPPQHLTGRVVGEDTIADDFRRGGLQDWRTIRKGLVEGGFDFDEEGAILDYGVGCGRIIRYFSPYAESCRLHGADVDAAAVAWCREHLPFGDYRELKPLPPSPFDDAQFDAVYAFSVFSHLPLAAHHAWLDELARITRPGAALALTVMGLGCAKMVAGEEREFPHPEPAIMREHMAGLEREGFAFFPYGELTCHFPENTKHFRDWDLSAYGTAYVTERYVREHWVKHFEVVAYHEAPDNWQDYVILRRR